MTPELMAQANQVAGVLEKGGILLVLVLLVLALVRGDLLGKKTVETMTTEIVKKTTTEIMTQIKAAIAEDIAKDVAAHLRAEITTQRRGGQW